MCIAMKHCNAITAMRARMQRTPLTQSFMGTSFRPGCVGVGAFVFDAQGITKRAHALRHELLW